MTVVKIVLRKNDRSDVKHRCLIIQDHDTKPHEFIALVGFQVLNR